MLDGLWPFALAYSNGQLDRCHQGAPIYVLDVGLYMLPLLTATFPQLSFVPFYRIDDLPPVYEVVTLRGPGMARFGSDSNPFHAVFGGEEGMRTIREVILKQLGITPQGTCIVLLSRQMDPHNLRNFHLKSSLDRSRESPFLRWFHYTGEHVYTSLYYGDTTGHERRTIRNEQALFQEMAKVFNKKYGMCVKLVQLDKLSVKEQIETFASAKLVIAQHGAGLSLAAFMPNTDHDRGIVLELLPRINPNFQLACEGMGVEHRFLNRTGHGDVYATNDDMFIEVSARRLVRVAMSALVGWAPPRAGGVIDQSSSSPSEVALAERRIAEASMLSEQQAVARDEQPLCTAPRTMEEGEETPSQSVVPEVPYIRQMLGRGIPFVWADSGFEGIFKEEDGGSLPWARAGRVDWEESMRR